MNAKHWPEHIKYMTLLNFRNDPVNESLHIAGEKTETGG